MGLVGISGIFTMVNIPEKLVKRITMTKDKIFNEVKSLWLHLTPLIVFTWLGWVVLEILLNIGLRFDLRVFLWANWITDLIVKLDILAATALVTATIFKIHAFDRIQTFYVGHYRNFISEKSGIQDPMALIALQSPVGTYLKWNHLRVEQIAKHRIGLGIQPYVILGGVVFVLGALSFLNITWFLHLKDFDGASIFNKNIALNFGMLVIPGSFLLFGATYYQWSNVVELCKWRQNSWEHFKIRSRKSDPEFDEMQARSDLVQYFDLEDISDLPKKIW